MSLNLATILRESTAQYPEKPLAHVGGRTFTYAQVDEMSGRVAASLRELGLRPGQTVAVQLPNVPQFLFAYFGVLKAGLVMLPLNPLLRTPEIAYHLEDSNAALLVTFDLFAPEALKAAEATGVPTYVVTSPGNDSAPDGARHFDELYRAADDGEIAETGPDDTAVLLYTSGTTGKPKGAELTHSQMHTACTIAGEVFGYQPSDVSLLVLPMFHVFGLSSTLNVSVRYGGSVVLVPRFELGPVLDALETYRCTVFCGVPTMFIGMVQADIGGRDLSAMRVGVSGGASIPGEVIRAFEEKYEGTVVLEGYGLSETVALATFNQSADARKVLSVGRPMPRTELRIVDAAGAELPPGPDNVGEIVLRGPTLMKGYYNKPADTAEAIRDGWFYTGDLAYRDDDGFVFIVDRKKDMVIRGGFNVYPREIEEVLYQHPAVAEAAVIGRADDRLGEEVVAFVSLRPGTATDPDELTAFCKDRLAAYKYPREITVLADLPKGPTGKLLKNELRQL
jgi:long-chain acyl-CoA synthetase